MKKLSLLVLLAFTVPAKAENARITLGLEYLGVGGVNDAFEKDGTDFTNALNGAGINAGFSQKTTAAVGFRAGVIKGLKNDFEIGGSIGVVAGPTVKQTYTNGPFSSGGINYNSNGETRGETNMNFFQLMIEGAKKIRVGDKTFVRLGVGAGAARGIAKQTIETSGSAGNLVSALGIRKDVTENWSGFAWEISPAIVFPFGSSEMEIGVRYAQFPTKKESDDMSKIEWHPLGIFANFRFGA